MKHIFKAFSLHIVIGVFSLFTLGVVYAAWNDDVSDGDNLTSDRWNDLVTQVESLGGGGGGGKFIDGTDSNDAVYSGGNVGIGTNDPQGVLSIEKNATNGNEGYIKHTVARDSVNGGGIHFGRARGLVENPVVLQDGDVLTYISSAGYDGSTYRQGSLYTTYIDGTVSSGVVPGAHSFDVYNQSGSRIDALEIKSDGNIGIGTSSPSYPLHVLGNNPSSYIAYFNNSGTHGAAAQGTSYGLVGYSSTGNGVLGQNTSTTAYGYLGSNHHGVVGYGKNTGYGVYGNATGNYGVYGKTTSASHGGVLGYSANGSIYGILGHANAWTLYGNGNTYVSGTYQSSDERLKENIQNISGGLDKILNLRPVSYTWKENSLQGKNNSELQFGLIAQEAEEVIPKIVRNVETPSLPEGETSSINEQLGSTKAIEYTDLIPFLIDAIQEQQSEIELLKQQLQ